MSDPRRGSYEYEIQIRDTESHTSTDAGSDADVTVLTDEITGADFGPYSKFRVFFHDTHDQSFDGEVEGTWKGDDGWSAGDTLVSGGPFDSQDFTNSVQFDGPVGDLRLNFTAPSTAPTSGRLTVVIAAVN